MSPSGPEAEKSTPADRRITFRTIENSAVGWGLSVFPTSTLLNQASSSRATIDRVHEAKKRKFLRSERSRNPAAEIRCSGSPYLTLIACRPEAPQQDQVARAACLLVHITHFVSRSSFCQVCLGIREQMFSIKSARRFAPFTS